MKLKKGLKMIKAKEFCIFVYEKGYFTKSAEERLNECPINIIDIQRNKHGKFTGGIPFAAAEVKEIIPHTKGVNIVVEV